MSGSNKVWVIGANSFTGSYLVPALKKASYCVDETTVDITNAQQVELQMLRIQPDYVINLAGISFVPDGMSAEIYAVNAFGPQNILDACLKLAQSPEKIILASTSHVYGEQTCEVIDEACPVNPINHYGCSKWAMEQIAKTYNKNLNIQIVRPFNYTGKQQEEKFLIPKIVEHFKKKSKSVKLGNIDIWRDFSDVRWVVNTYTEILGLKSVQNIQTVNLCSGQLISIRGVIEELQDMTGHGMQVEVMSDLVRSTDMKKQCGSNRKLYSELQHLEQPIDIKSTLAWMLTKA